MSKIDFFEPSMCCSTGVCGSSADPELLRLESLMEALKKAGIEAARYNLSSDPKAFMQNAEILNVLNQHGEEALPITVVDGRIVKSGSYPTNEEIAGFLGISADVVKPVAKVHISKCNCGPKGCC